MTKGRGPLNRPPIKADTRLATVPGYRRVRPGVCHGGSRERGSMDIYLLIGLGIVVAGVVFVAVGVGFVTSARRTKKRSRASLSWPTVPGTVRASDVLTTYHDHTRYDRASVLYQYVVGGTTYLSDTVSVTGVSVAGNMQQALETVSRHPVGSAVRVYYDPDDPEAAVLVPGTSAFSGMTLAMGIFFAVTGVGEVLVGLIWVALVVFVFGAG